MGEGTGKKGRAAALAALLDCEYMVRYAGLLWLRWLLLFVRAEPADHMSIAEMGIEFASDTFWAEGPLFVAAVGAFTTPASVVLGRGVAEECPHPLSITCGAAIRNSLAVSTKVGFVQINRPLAVDAVTLKVCHRPH